ncbi:MAG: hypothetical protein ACE15C_15810 [Phycisphaerae bacterium]
MSKHIVTISNGRFGAILAALGLAMLAGGCAGAGGDPQRMQRGYVYYLDGAGGGGLNNWGGGVRDGLLKAGYDGGGKMFRWETGLGVLADQTASNEYKRGKAAELADQMADFHRQYPDAPITVIGLSAGTAIAVFALESLPPGVMVDNVILLSGSLSATHDLTSALGRVQGKVYITTSHRDAVLGGLLPLAGTADRDSGTNATIGIEGPELPPGASDQTRSLYASKLQVVPWKQEFARYGNNGGHTDTVAAPFIEHYIAPLVKTSSGTQFAAAGPAPAGSVRNPDYERWARFETGSWVTMEGQRTVDGATKPIRLKVTLVSKNAGQVVFRREDLDAQRPGSASPFSQTIYASANIAPTESPVTHPSRRLTQLPDVTVRVGTRDLTCKSATASAPGDFHDWGSNPQATICTSTEIPGGIARIDIRTRFAQKSIAVRGQVTDYFIAKPSANAARLAAR